MLERVRAAKEAVVVRELVLELRAVAAVGAEAVVAVAAERRRVLVVVRREADLQVLEVRVRRAEDRGGLRVAELEADEVGEEDERVEGGREGRLVGVLGVRDEFQLRKVRSLAHEVEQRLAVGRVDADERHLGDGARDVLKQHGGSRRAIAGGCGRVKALEREERLQVDEGGQRDDGLSGVFER